MHYSKTDSLYLQLKHDIVHGKLPQNTALKQTLLAERYGVSRIPIRDTLQRLKNDGWLSNHGKSSVMIRPLNSSDAEDLYLMRLHLEPMLLGHAIPNINFETLGKAQDILLKLKSSEPRDRPALFDTVTQLHQLCARYIGFQEMELDYLSHSQNEHEALLTALREDDRQKANKVLTEHIRIAGEQLVRYLKQSL